MYLLSDRRVIGIPFLPAISGKCFNWILIQTSGPDEEHAGENVVSQMAIILL